MRRRPRLRLAIVGLRELLFAILLHLHSSLCGPLGYTTRRRHRVLDSHASGVQGRPDAMLPSLFVTASERQVEVLGRRATNNRPDQYETGGGQCHHLASNHSRLYNDSLHAGHVDRGFSVVRVRFGAHATACKNTALSFGRRRPETFLRPRVAHDNVLQPVHHETVALLHETRAASLRGAHFARRI